MEKETINLPKVLLKNGMNPDILKGLTTVALLDSNKRHRKIAIHQLIEGFNNEKCVLEKGFTGDNQMFLICRDIEGYQLTAYIADVPKKYQGKKLMTNFTIRDKEIYY